MDDFDDGVGDDPLEEDIDGQDDSLKFREFVRVCPGCKQPITEEMDSCPYCGDIIFRHLKDGIFAPRKGPLVKIVAVLIILLVALALVAMLLQMIL